MMGVEYSQAEEDEEEERVAVREAVLREHNLHRENAGLDALEWDQQLERLGGCKERLNPYFNSLLSVVMMYEVVLECEGQFQILVEAKCYKINHRTLFSIAVRICTT